jgi:hypothetical protein
MAEPILSDDASAKLVAINEGTNGTTVKLDVGGKNPGIKNMPTRGQARQATFDFEGLAVVIRSTRPHAVHLGTDPITLVITRGNPKWDRPERGILTIKCGRLSTKAHAALRVFLERDVRISIRPESDADFADIDQGMFAPPAPIKKESKDGDDDYDAEGDDEDDGIDAEDADDAQFGSDEDVDEDAATPVGSPDPAKPKRYAGKEKKPKAPTRLKAV